MPEYLIAFNAEWVREHSPDELDRKRETSTAVVAQMQDAGVFVYANGGIDASTLVAGVEAPQGTPVFSDGPYVETKEHLGGFTVIDVPDDETARGWAGRMAAALEWPQVIHRFPGPGRLGHPRPSTTTEA